MANSGFAYQYETSPRKLKPEYTNVKKKKQPVKKQVKTASKNKIAPKNTKTTKQKQEENRKQKILVAKTKFMIFVKSVLIFAILFFILFRNSQISEAFSKIQGLKSDITAIQKENDQLEINIQNSMNVNNIEQSAKELLGMQKLTQKQIIYINLPKKDYVEYRTEEVIVEQEKNFFENIVEKIKNIF